MTRAQLLRKQAGDAEDLWGRLRNRCFSKYKIRRQHPVEPYILDFYCASCHLAIELDGGGHNDPTTKRRDSEQTEFLNRNGIEVVRFWNYMVLREIDGVLGTIDLAVQERSKKAQYIPHPGPLPSAKGEGKEDSSAITRSSSSPR